MTAVGIAFAVGGLASGFLVWKLGLHRISAPGRVLIDQATGSTVTLRYPAGSLL